MSCFASVEDEEVAKWEGTHGRKDISQQRKVLFVISARWKLQRIEIRKGDPDIFLTEVRIIVSRQ